MHRLTERTTTVSLVKGRQELQYKHLQSVPLLRDKQSSHMRESILYQYIRDSVPHTHTLQYPSKRTGIPSCKIMGNCNYIELQFLLNTLSLLSLPLLVMPSTLQFLAHHLLYLWVWSVVGPVAMALRHMPVHLYAQEQVSQ